MKKKLLLIVINSFLIHILFILLKIVFLTYKIKIPKNFKIPKDSFIVAYWHRKIFAAIPIYKKMGGIFKNTYPMISIHRDGEFLAKILQKFGFKDIRGSTSKGGVNALKQAIVLLKNKKVVVVTPDGPRGPNYSIQNGFVGMVFISKSPILNIRYDVSNYWQINSWDKMIIPKPFSTIFVKPEIIYPENLNKNRLGAKIKEVMQKDV